MSARKAFFLSLFLLALWPIRAGASDDLQSWSLWTLETHRAGKFSVLTHGQVRIVDDVQDAGFFLISERLRYRFSERWDLGVSYTYLENEIEDRTKKTEEFKYQHRLEVEANPRWTLWNRLKVKNRNRLEFRWIEDKGSDNARLRHRWEFECAFPRAESPRSLYFNNEFFYDLSQREHNENRFVPFGVRFRVHPKTTLGFFYMIQWKKGPKDWSSNQVLGTEVNLAF